jgi:hypothetical protein
MLAEEELRGASPELSPRVWKGGAEARPSGASLNEAEGGKKSRLIHHRVLPKIVQGRRLSMRYILILWLVLLPVGTWAQSAATNPLDPLEFPRLNTFGLIVLPTTIFMWTATTTASNPFPEKPSCSQTCKVRGS